MFLISQNTIILMCKCKEFVSILNKTFYLIICKRKTSICHTFLSQTLQETKALPYEVEKCVLKISISKSINQKLKSVRSKFVFLNFLLIFSVHWYKNKTRNTFVRLNEAVIYSIFEQPQYIIFNFKKKKKNSEILLIKKCYLYFWKSSKHTAR